MATPTLAQARSHYQRQRLIVANAVRAARAMLRRGSPLPEVASTVAAYQVASATASAASVAGMAGDTQPLTLARAFAGVSSAGFPLIEPMIATLDQHLPAPAEAIPANWWTDAVAETAEAFSALEQLIASEIADAGRTAAQVEFVARPDWQNYVRMLQPPSCSRCAILAGRIYRDLDAFDRHPGCDCVMVPVQDWESAHDAGMVSSFAEAFEKGEVRDLSKADARAISDGANPIEVVNARRAGLRAPAGITNAVTAEVFGRRVKATLHGTTRRSAWRKANPTRLVRLRPEAIYQIVDREYGGDITQAVRLLRLYGYLK